VFHIFNPAGIALTAFFCLLDILYDELSVEEHLELIAKVKEIFLFL